MFKKNNLFTSSIFTKFIMASTGLFLIFFITIHLLGNLDMFFGKDAVNEYGVFLRSMPKILWTMRIVLICAFVLHIFTSIRLSLKNKKARPIAYAKTHSVRATIASRTMMLSGSVLLAFVIFHLAQLTWGLINPQYANLMDEKGRHDVYNMTVLGFQNIYIVLFYIIAQIFLCMHLSHGFSSAAQTLGLTAKNKWADLLRYGGVIYAVCITLLYISIPVSVWLGIIKVEL